MFVIQAFKSSYFPQKPNHTQTNNTMKTKLMTIALFLTCQLAFGQNDSIRQQILKMETSKSALINNGRVLLLEKFMDGDITKVKEIKDYLLSLEGYNYVALYPGEKWLILFQTKEYQPILEDIRNYKKVLDIDRNKILPLDDNLFERLRAKSYSEKEQLFQDIEEAQVSDEEKELLIMHLTLGLKTNAETPDLSQEELNNRADWFLQTYPNSFGASYTREYIRDQWRESYWGWGFELFLGGGPLTSKLRNQFDVPGFIGMELAASYKKFHFYQRDFLGFTTLLRDVESPDRIWLKGADAEVVLWEFSVGYAALETRKIKLVPFTGIGGFNIEPPKEQIDKEPDLGTFRMNSKTTFTVGANLDIKLGRCNYPFVTFSGRENTRWILRLRYEYAIPHFTPIYPGYNGNMHLITIGFGAFGHKIVRQK
jgi:hypothetical protein